MAEKTDNHNLKAKLDLRRYFLRKYYVNNSIYVIDCCQGGGVIWDVLRKEFSLNSYWGLDLKPKKGRLKLDSVRVLQQPGWSQNIIDVDTYGTPWKHWVAMLPNITRPSTVFLTVGQRVTGTVGKMSKEAIGAIGLGFLYPKLPPAFHVKLSKFVVSYLLTMAYDYGIIINEAIEVESDNLNVRYIGVRLEPQKTSDLKAVTSGRSKRKQSNKEIARV